MIPASTRRLRSAALQDDLASAPRASGDDGDTADGPDVDTPDKGEHDMGNVEEYNSPSPSSEAVPIAPGRHYNTRPKNDPHPARTAHLARRSHAEVKEELEAEIRKKKAALDAQQEEYQRHIDELADLEENLDLQAEEDSIENVLERESQMIMADEATLKVAAAAMGLGSNGKHLISYDKQGSPRCCWDGHLEGEGNVDMDEAAPDESDLSGSDSDVRTGSKRKARKQSAKVCVCYAP